MTEQMHEPDAVADEKARAQKVEREALADGGGRASPADEAADDESSYSTEAEQGAAQPTPDGRH
ncbi:hypothetical protein [Longivirga aurantiaca]|uniref:Uncharacterized protein n=1 Tax=Longivirga aurantiaca TaxID=1837743 RepID=A0ABW1T2D3_9ACTN